MDRQTGVEAMKIVLHAHSTWSYDGRWDLARIARFYGAFGVDAVMMTEHDTGFVPSAYETYRQACAAASTARCTLVPGIEYSCPDNDIHILTWGLPDFLAEHRPVAETLEAVARAGGAAVFAHPVRRSAFRLFDRGWIPLLSGVEIWNRKSDGLTWGREAEALVAETGLAPTVGQDFHRLRHAYPLTMHVERPEGELEIGLVAALQQGAMSPMALGRPLIQAGRLQHVPHDRLERMRSGLRDAIRGKRS